MYHKEVIEQLVKFISERDGIADKSRLAPQVQQSFCLVKERSVFYGKWFAIKILLRCIQKLQQYRSIFIRSS